MMKKLGLSITIALLVTSLVAVPVLAAYYVWFTVTESTGTDYTELAMNMTLDVEMLVDEGYIAVNGTDTRVTDDDYNVLPHMLADDRVLWVGNVTGNDTTQFIFWSGQTALTSFPIITGHGGYVTMPDTASLEPDDIYAFGIVAWFDMSGGTNRTIVYKEGALDWNADTAGHITFNVTGGNVLDASGILSGYHTVMVYNDGVTMWIEVDDTAEDSAGASAIPDTANGWVLFQNDVCPYVSYYSEWLVT